MFQLPTIWKLIKSVSPAHRPPLSSYGPNCSCVCVALPTGPSITGGGDCCGNWQPFCHLAKTIWMEPKWPLADLVVPEFFFFLCIYLWATLSIMLWQNNKFILPDNDWAIRTHFIIMKEQYVTKCPNNVWKWMRIGKVRDAHTKRRHGCDGLRPIPEGWEGGLWANTVPFSIFHRL